MGKFTNLLLLLGTVTILLSLNSFVAARYLPTRSGGGGQDDRLIKLKELIREVLSEVPSSASSAASTGLNRGSGNGLYYSSGPDDGRMLYETPESTDNTYYLMKRLLLHQLSNNSSE